MFLGCRDSRPWEGVIFTVSVVARTTNDVLHYIKLFFFQSCTSMYEVKKVR